MTYVRRLRAVGAILALAAVLTTSHVWGDPANKTSEKRRVGSKRTTPAKADQDFVEDLASSKFAKGGVLTYRTTGGDVLFALQLKPKLEPAPSRPRDYLVMVDTSASQVKGPLTIATDIAAALAAQAGTQDRLAIWTVNIPEATTNLTRGFRNPQSEQVREALATLQKEVPLGDTDLKDGLEKAVASFSHDEERQQVIVFLGDGLSVHNPITPADRAHLSDTMIQNGITFFPVPLGPKLDPANLHGLATGTGGVVVRRSPQESAGDVAKRLAESVAAPVLYPKNFTLGAEVAEAFPTKIPPVRADVPTLIIGRLKSACAALGYTLEGVVAGREVRLESSESVSESEPDNFFLVSMAEQWKHGKDQPALTRADRALAYAHQQSQLVRADLLAQAEWALGRDKLAAAETLFQQAKKLDPQDVEAEAGLKIVEKLRAGTIKKQELQAQLAKDDKEKLRDLAQATDKKQSPPPPADIAPPAAPGDILEEQKRRVAIEEQRASQAVEEAQRQARRILTTDPDAAKDLLKRAYASVRDNIDLSERVRQLLSAQLETGLRSVETQGVRIKRDRDEQQRLFADAQRRLDIERARTADEDRLQARFTTFANLMAQARYEDATLQMLGIREDAIREGKPIPPAVTAGYDIALAANNLSQIQELRRVREERFLLTMMQVERSHVPFPDEPPIQFPPAATWREITRLRKEKYENSGLTEDDPVTLRRIKRLQSQLAQPVTLDKGLDANTQFKDALEFISDRYDITILVDTQAFKTDNSVESVDDLPVKLPRMVGVSLGTVLRLLAAQVNGTYLIRRDYIEITTGQRAVAEKVIRVYPVADLVFPIPNSINQRVVNQTLSILGTAPGIGLQLGSPQALGGLGALGLAGALGALGLGGIGGLGALGLGGLGGLGALGIAGGALGLAGGGLAGAQGGFGGGLGFAGGGQVNLGAGGGALGFGGGQLGQFGNLGGQFGLQGGDQSAILVELIRQVVGNPREWSRPGAFQGRNALNQPAALNPAGQPGDEDEGDKFTPDLLNSLGYYPPARALVVKATSRIHTNLGGGLLGPRGPGMAALDRQKDGALVIAPKRNGGDGPLAAAPRSDGKGPADGKNPKGSPDNKDQPGLARAPLDPKKIWENALVKGVNDPGLIIAVADFLAERKLYNHLAEFLKAELRQGIVARAWVYEALAMALEASGGTPVEIERARLSAIDLQPLDAQGLVRASKTLADNKQYSRAIAYCRQAALLEPNVPYPYEEALMYAELAKDPTTVEWAAGNLLRQDWPVDNQDLHQKATTELKNFAQSLKTDNRTAEAERLQNSTGRLAERDLVIELTWGGEADLDLEVLEPIGTRSSFLQRQTPGGGILLGDTLADNSRESYVAAKAFSGDYQVTIRRIWGRPLGGKATLEIIQHQGTSRETRHRETVVFDRSSSLTVTLADGRRTSAEYVPPPAATQRPKQSINPLEGDRVMQKLRALADPEYMGGETRGGLAALGITPPPVRKLSPQQLQSMADVTVYQTRLGPAERNGFDMTANASIGPDGQAWVKLSPVFQTVNRTSTLPPVVNPLIPGGGDQPGGR
jgi:hypothetical protein